MEKISKDASDAGKSGYSRSKWVAEAICAAAAEKLPGLVNILRIGQLTGDTEDGIWNISEAWPLMMSTLDVLDCLPQIEQTLNWLPLDITGAAVVQIALQSAKKDDQYRVYHLVNNSSETTWSDLLIWTEEFVSKPFDIVPPTVWLDKLENYPKKHPAKNLIGLWRNAHGNEDGKIELVAPRSEMVFSISEAHKESIAMQNLVALDKPLMNKIWSWLEGEITAAKTLVYVSRNRYNSV